jgi:hypothetical protein
MLVFHLDALSFFVFISAQCPRLRRWFWQQQMYGGVNLDKGFL